MPLTRLDACRIHPYTHVNELLHIALPEVTADLGGKQHTSTSTQLPVLFVELALQHELLKVHIGHGHSHRLQATFFRQVPHLSFQTVGRMGAMSLGQSYGQETMTVGKGPMSSEGTAWRQSRARVQMRDVVWAFLTS